jgi:hypothetical protein
MLFVDNCKLSHLDQPFGAARTQLSDFNLILFDSSMLIIHVISRSNRLDAAIVKEVDHMPCS